MVEANNISRRVHDLVCGAYAELPARPSKSHRICILFPAEEDKPRVIWVPTDDFDAMRAVVTSGSFRIEMSGGPRLDHDNEVDDCRRIWFVCVENFNFLTNLPQNQSLRFATAGRPLKLVRGSLLVTATESVVGHEDTWCDVSPGDILPVLAHFVKPLHGLF